MSSLSTATAAPVIFELHGEKLWLSPLSFDQLGLIERFARQEIVKAADSLLAEEPDQTRRAEILRHAFNEALWINVLEPGVRLALLRSIRISMQVVLMSLNNATDNNHKFNMKELDGILGNDHNALYEMAVLVWYNSFVDYDEDGKPEPQKQQKKATPKNPPEAETEKAKAE